MRAGIFYGRDVSPIPCMCLVFFLLILLYMKKERIIFRMTNQYYFCFFKHPNPRMFYTCVRDCNLYCVVPKLRAKLLLTRISLYLAMQGACAIITALTKRPEINFQLSRVIRNLAYFCYIKIQKNIFNSILPCSN